MVYTYNQLCTILNGTIEDFASQIAKSNEDVHTFLLTYCAARQFGETELRYLEIMIAISYLFKNTINAVLCSNILLTLPHLDLVLLQNQEYIDDLDLVSEGFHVFKSKAGIDCLNLPATSSLRCLCETTLLYVLLSDGILINSFDDTFTQFCDCHSFVKLLDDAEQNDCFISKR